MFHALCFIHIQTNRNGVFCLSAVAILQRARTVELLSITRTDLTLIVRGLIVTAFFSKGYFSTSAELLISNELLENIL